MRPPRRPFPLIALCSSLAFLPLACGGGGGGSGSGGGSGGSVPGANLNVTLDGSSTAYGTVVSGLSPGDTIEVRIRNQGTQAFNLSPALLSASDDLDVRDFDLQFSSDYVAPSGPGASAMDATGSNPLMLQQEDPVFGLSLHADPLAMKELAQRNAGPMRLEEFALPGGDSVGLELYKLPSPWADGAMLRVDGEHQAQLLEQVQQDYSAWSGRIAGQPHSNVFLSFSSHGCQGWLQTEHEIYHVMAEPTEVRNWSSPQVRIMRERELLTGAFAAPGLQSCQPIRAQARQRGEQKNASTSLGMLCRMALETDYDYLGVKFADDQNAATTYAMQLVSAVGHQFQTQVQTRMSLAYLALYTTSDDPWQTPDVGGTALQLLEEFRDAWLNDWPVEADAAHLLCAGMNAGGVSYLDEVGDPRWAFSVSTYIQGNLNWSNFPFNPSPFNWDFIVVAHETGHLFNADHTHNYCPPFDECAKGSAWGTCQDETDCSRKGTILSYCHTCVGGTNKILLHFEPYIANQMRISADEHLESRVLDPGETLVFEIEYDPRKGGDSKVNLEWTHNAANASSPFLIELNGRN